MDFQLSEDQRAFADMAQGLFNDYCSDDQLRAHDLSGAGSMQDLWQQCVAAGLHGILVPETHGGLGLGMTELMAVLEQQGRALALVPLWEQQLVAAAVARFAPEAADTLLPAAMAGELLALSLAGLSASRGHGVQLRDGRLHGGLQAVPLADLAGHALLAVADEQGADRLVLPALSQPAVQRETGLSQHHQGLADLRLDAAPVLAVLPTEATAWVEQRAIACAAALQLGVTQQQLRRTVEYVSERRQFERPIGSFQLVAGQMADGQIATEALRAALWQLVWRLDAGRPSAPQAHATRALANDLGHRAGHMAQHVHGGMGVDVTYPIHRFLYWSRALGALLGGSEHHLARLGDWLADNDNLGWKYDLPEDC
ncbi:acyl-CoA dehydrogenase family protein [Sphaerotilus microaerophilus]|jgi:alkylation response protein AidB-like acyl-CoA dehydrogenase|uniref:Acyl-CoA dehydrogenase n=1 Tax=Sphaerotilus microaerophilus TaxID=2914710 RepID=A0ABN6PM11_9BURK|nr:acyl-CoA dehydrogenase family protein [Sphaerotilus sp. FB-5]BDI06211.1 acyl-CoA dehydrogenase [Sphaerotilus sp. FB-5]